MSLFDRLLRRPPPPSARAPLSRTIDLDDPRIAADPFPHYDRLRLEGDIVHLPRHGFWIVLGHEAARSIFRQPELFSNRGYEQIDHVLLAADPPRHGPVRKILSQQFGGEALRRIGGLIGTAAAGLLRPELDIVSDYARPLSRMAARELIGFDEATELEIALLETEPADSPEGFARRAEGLDRLADRAMSFQALVRDGAGLLSAGDVRSLVRLMWLASTATTERTIAHAVLRLLREPDLKRRLSADRGLLPAFIDETLRLHPAENLIRRVATRNASQFGADIAEGAFVQICLPAANRDPRWIDAPNAFRLDRGPVQSLSFGSGIHQCVGGPLTRRMVAAALEPLLGRDLHPAVPLDRIAHTHTMIALAPRELPVRLERRSR